MPKNCDPKHSTDAIAAPAATGPRRAFAIFAQAKTGATAVEFGMLAPFFLATILFMITVGYMLFMAQSLDYATQKAARQLRTGNVQSSNLNQTQFRTQVVCPLLPSMFNCDDVIVNLQAVPFQNPHLTDYYPYQYWLYVNAQQTGLVIPQLDNSQTSYCPGNGSSPTVSYYRYLQVLYPVNLLMSFLSTTSVATTYQGRKVYLIMSTATFLNEPFNAPVAAC